MVIIFGTYRDTLTITNNILRISLSLYFLFIIFGFVQRINRGEEMLVVGGREVVDMMREIKQRAGVAGVEVNLGEVVYQHSSPIQSGVSLSIEDDDTIQNSPSI